MIVTGIGSRETPSHILTEMTLIGRYCFENKITLRSGHALGADWAFEKGAQSRCIIYLPSESFNREYVSDAHRVIVPNEERYNVITNKFHPNPFALKPFARMLMNRNVCQVLGINLDRLSDYIVCWTKDGKDIGGTSQAIRIARAHKIPIINMYYEEYDTCQKIIQFLK